MSFQAVFQYFRPSFLSYTVYSPLYVVRKNLWDSLSGTTEELGAMLIPPQLPLQSSPAHSS